MSNPIQQIIDDSKLQWANESIEKGAMSTKEIIEKLTEFKSSNKNIIIEMNNSLFTTFFEADSWRGSYNLPAIDYCNSEDGCTVNVALSALNKINGMEVTGYKGGDYTLRDIDPIFIANYGESNYCTAIVDIVETQDYIVLLTRQDMY